MQTINSSFADQAKEFENPNMNFSKKEYLDYTMRAIGAKETDTVLEAAAGTCVCGRTLAPMVQKVVCLDATQPMLDVGIKNASEAGIGNMEFIHGLIEEIPFPEASFDVVMTRLSFHHFQEMKKPFSEMDRVLKPGGKAVVLELSVPQNRLVRWAYDLYFLHVLPRIGGAVSGDRAAYKYLPASVHNFPSPNDFCRMMEEAGFRNVRCRTFSSGLCRMFVGER
jgi:demethylmenaquinone methyltransferase/2-methoxy-6-polyprenyl-1,4-benzoquinol methylase